MHAAHQRGSASILKAVNEIKGLASKDGRQSSLAVRRNILNPTPRISHHKAETATEQYSQTRTLGKAEGELARKKIMCSGLDGGPKTNMIPVLQIDLQRPRRFQPRAKREPVAPR